MEAKLLQVVATVASKQKRRRRPLQTGKQAAPASGRAAKFNHLLSYGCTLWRTKGRRRSERDGRLSRSCAHSQPSAPRTHTHTHTLRASRPVLEALRMGQSLRVIATERAAARDTFAHLSRLSFALFSNCAPSKPTGQQPAQSPKYLARKLASRPASQPAS